MMPKQSFLTAWIILCASAIQYTSAFQNCFDVCRLSGKAMSLDVHFIGGKKGVYLHSIPIKVLEGPAGPGTPRPQYRDGWADQLFLAVFRARLVRAMGVEDAAAPGYDGLMELIAGLNNENRDKKYVQDVARQTLVSLFPSWLPPAFSALFSKNLPEFSCRMNAWVTLRTCGWLMGPDMELTDVETGDGGVAPRQGLLVKRCRFLEEAGCASICVNTCKIPTQTFFKEDMGLDLLMEPNYEDFSCQFSFGKSPPLPEKDEAFSIGCLAQCPHKGSRGGAEYKQTVRCHRIDLLEPEDVKM
mmetsp:Transcript_3936/g.5472  ORF Transcript_3936/g.5472 Transcript_3936/m.5472 type:complete len:300 (-) Transcript_3936:80-979(-)